MVFNPKDAQVDQPSTSQKKEDVVKKDMPKKGDHKIENVLKNVQDETKIQISKKGKHLNLYLVWKMKYQILRNQFHLVRFRGM